MLRLLKLVPAVLIATALMSALAVADPARWANEGWRTDFSKTSVDLARIRSGGPARDGIPPLDNPKFVPLTEEQSLGKQEPVIALVVNGEAKAYPLRVLTWHEIANDVIGGVAVAVTYCPLCNSSLVFERSVDGSILDFGTTGKLKDSNLIMYDRQSDSWWQQFTGEAVVGEATGKRLTRLPSTVMPWGDFVDQYPDGTVLVPNDPNLRRYGENPYVGYDLSGFPFLYDGLLPPGINPMEYVVIIERGDDDPLIVPLKHLSDRETLSLDGFALTWQKGLNSALDQRAIGKGRDIGAVRVTRHGKPAVHDVTFAFVAHAFHPGVQFVRE